MRVLGQKKLQGGSPNAPPPPACLGLSGFPDLYRAETPSGQIFVTESKSCIKKKIYYEISTIPFNPNIGCTI